MNAFKISIRCGQLLGGVASVLLLSCSSTEIPLAASDAPSRSLGAIAISAQGRLVRMGDGSAFSTADEKPIGTVRFAHDFWMDTTEVTQGEFSRLLGRNPAPSASQGALLPAVNVSWYDAVLFCNARSKRDGLDSVYEYASVTTDSAGSAWMIAGLASHFDRSGWRLPTEAEWELAARAGTITSWPWGELSDSSNASENAWYQGNASGHAHEVATRSGNCWGLHDLTGNVMEWVHDWKGTHPSDTVGEYAGPEAPADIPEVPLKGGAFNYGLASLRPSNRMATYAAYRSSRAEYVGFRCVRGAFHPVYGNASGQILSVPPVTLQASNLPTLLGATSAKLVFLNRTQGKGMLSWVDFGEASPLVRSLPDKDPVFHPVISPDGQWVAWSTVLEGSPQAGHIKARLLSKNDTNVLDLGEGAIPRWWTSGSDTFLVRTSSAMDNTGSAWKDGTTTAQTWSGGKLTGSVVNWSSGSYHDGRTGNLLYTGYRRLRQKDLASGTERILFTYPSNGKSVGDTSQVCNVSASPDASGRAMFLDFGYSSNSTVVGHSYGIHEIAFVSDSTGAVTRTYPAPSGEQQWEHLEWSNHPRWAVSAAIDGTGAQKNLYTLDLTTGNAVKIASGEELWQPGLWVGGDRLVGTGQVDPDSLCVYGDGEFATRGPWFFARSKVIDAVFVGSSHMANGVLPGAMHAVNGSNLAFAGSNVSDQSEVVNNYVLPVASNLRVVVLSFMPGWLFEPVENPSRSPWYAMKASLGYQYDSKHDFWKFGTLEGFETQARRKAVASALAGIMDSTGAQFVRSDSQGWSGALNSEFPIPNQDTTNLNYPQNMAILEMMIGNLTKRGIKVLLVKFPESPSYAQMTKATRYGPSWEMYHKIVAKVKSWESSNSNFTFYDAYLDGAHDYVDDEALNTDHLNVKGATRLTARIDSLLKKILLP
jgi:uncharacterized protein (TIGR02171 family)